MKSYVYLFLFLLISPLGYSQSKKELREQVRVLSCDKINLLNEKQKLLEEKQKLLETNLELKQQINDLTSEVKNCQGENENLRASLSTNSNNSSKSGFSAGTNRKSNSTQSPQKSTERCQAITASGTQCSRMAEPGSKYCWQHKKTYEPEGSNANVSTISSSNANSSTTSTSSGRTIYTGPRGGHYYINSKGNKVYIKK